MTTYPVAGGTGTAGRAVVTELVRRGETVRVLSRRPGAQDGAVRVTGDLVRGTGLAAALAGVDVVIGTTDGKTRSARRVLDTGTANLLAAARRSSRCATWRSHGRPRPGRGAG
ncbi:SDR family oxidoreductase [Prescottella subtropica]|uniref:SDR family oxidoreductase n=1 Tax=Prescottella subtropica TaxID=2545757 RepID=UPI001F4F7980|nr:NAD(P)H-binding protein [Prescottella subtropica]